MDLSGTLKISHNWQASTTLTGPGYSPLSCPGTIPASASFGSDVSNTEQEGADMLASFIVSIAGGANATLDLTSVTNILQSTGQSFGRIKNFCFRLLSESNDSSIGTNCSQVDIGNASTNSQQFNLPSGANFSVFAGGAWAYLDERANGFTVNSTQKNVFFKNRDSSITAKVQCTLVGGTN